MIILALESSTPMSGAAIFKDGQVAAKAYADKNMINTDAVLNQLINDCLSQSQLRLEDINGFASGIGPGRFTGVRISLNTIKTFGYLYHKPCVGFNTLDLMVRQVTEVVPSVTTMINAYKNMVYFAEYAVIKNAQGQIEYKNLQEPTAIRVQDLGNIITPNTLVLGDGYIAYQKYLLENLKLELKRNDSFSDYPDIQFAYELIKEKLMLDPNAHWNNLLPLYLRDSEAEENARGFKYKAL